MKNYCQAGDFFVRGPGEHRVKKTASRPVNIDVQINESSDMASRYISYSPSPCRLRLNEPSETSVEVTLSSRPAQNGGGQAVFFSSSGEGSVDQLRLSLPANGDWVSFGMGGKFNVPSVNDRDCLLAINGFGNEITIPLMVRVRKNANDLTTVERDRFLSALAMLNDAGRGVYQDFRNTHVDAANAEEHQGPQFLPWHRSFLLDLERRLQAIDPAVSLPFWRFDQPAPRVFQSDFMGDTAQASRTNVPANVRFNNSNPLVVWVTDGMPGILRSAFFATLTDPAPGPPRLRLINQQETLDLGNEFNQFATMERTPHGAAHVSFSGSISQIPTAVKDPLFFLLHANVDRLWALWQSVNNRFDPQEQDVYSPQNRDGRRLTDTLWPWNGVVTPPRPNFAPGGPMPSSSVTSAPGMNPELQAMIDYQGEFQLSNRLGYSYIDIPYETARTSRQLLSIPNMRDQPAELPNRLDSINELAPHNLPASSMEGQQSSELISPEVVHAPPEQLYLDLLSDQTQSKDTRLEALNVLKVYAISSPTFSEWRPTYLEVLRLAVQDSDLRTAALATLIGQGDRTIQEVLINGLENPEEALVDPATAFNLLSEDPHADVRILARQFVDQPSDIRTLESAIRYLSGDPQSVERLQRLIGDEQLPSNTRKLAVVTLNALDPEAVPAPASTPTNQFFGPERLVEAAPDESVEELLQILMRRRQR